MSEKFNSARRVRNILLAARSVQNPDQSVLDAWSKVLGTEREPGTSLFETVRLLGLLTKEAEKVQLEVAQMGLDKDDYAHTFQFVFAVTMATNLDIPWGQLVQQITPETLNQLGLFAQFSSVDEQVVPPEDLANLKQDLDAFLAEVMDNITDDRLRTFVVKQIRIILQGIREYPIRGEDAIRDGDATLLATFLSNHELIREHKGEEVVEETMSMWERMTNLLPLGNFGINLARMLMDVDPQKAIEAGSKAIEAGSDVIDKFP
jgi:hypothetical protein